RNKLIVTLRRPVPEGACLYQHPRWPFGPTKSCNDNPFPGFGPVTPIMHSSRNLIAALALCSLASTALAQFPGRGDSGRGFDRGRAQESRRGGGDDRERWRGGSRDGGESGDRDRWSRGSRGGWGGSRDGGER